MDWPSLFPDAIGAALGTGVVGVLGWLFASSYFGEKAKNLATKQDIAAITREVEQVKDEFQQAHEAQRHVNDLALKSVDYEHQLRLAALERKLDVHQEAYALWSKLLGSMHGDEAWNVGIECQRWWTEHNLFLAPAAREAFRDAYIAVTHMVQLKGVQEPESVQEWRRHMAVVRSAGNIIAAAVALPPIQLEYSETGGSG